MLKVKYKTKIPYCPFCQREMFSIENVENVVNPPQNPVTKRYFRYSFSLNKEENIPIKKHPKTLAKSVPIGKEPAIGSL